MVGDDFHVGRTMEWAAPGIQPGMQNGCGNRIGNQAAELGELESLNVEHGRGERKCESANRFHGKALREWQKGNEK